MNHLKTKLKYGLRKLEGLLTQADTKALGLSYCKKCLRGWHLCHEHTTYISNGCDMFCLCEECWKDTTPEHRLPYYVSIWNSWPEDDRPSRHELESAVLYEG